MYQIDATTAAVSAADYKRDRGILEADAGQDAAIASYLLAAQELVERAVGRPMTTRSYGVELPLGGWARWWVTMRPITSIDEVTLLERGKADVTVNPAELTLEAAETEPQIVLPSSLASRAAGPRLRLEMTAGATVPPVPEQMRQAVMLIAADWHEAQISIDGREPLATNFGAERLIRQVRYRPPRTFAAS